MLRSWVTLQRAPPPSQQLQRPCARHYWCVSTSTPCILSKLREKQHLKKKIKSLACSEAELLHEELHCLLSILDVFVHDLPDVFVLLLHVFWVCLGKSNTWKNKSLACSEAELLHEELHHLLSIFDFLVHDLPDVFIHLLHVFWVFREKQHMKHLKFPIFSTLGPPPQV